MDGMDLEQGLGISVDYILFICSECHFSSPPAPGGKLLIFDGKPRNKGMKHGGSCNHLVSTFLLISLPLNMVEGV